jgi:FkbM family methyltransferase
MKGALKRFVKKSIAAVGRTRLGGSVYQRVASATMENVKVVRHDGLELSFAVPNYVNSWRIASFATKEPETLRWIDSFPRGSVLWDIGANVGLYSCYAARRRDCRVIAFEPSVFNLELLARNVWLNDLTGKITLLPLPLSSTLAESTLNMSSTDWGGAMSTFGQTYTHDGSALRKIFEFRTVGLSMDDAAARLGVPAPDYIKMDVDGIEHLILKGGPGVLGRTQGVLVEINEEFEMQARDSASYLSAAGLTLLEKTHADMFSEGIFKNCYNQVWHRAQPQT